MSDVKCQCLEYARALVKFDASSGKSKFKRSKDGKRRKIASSLLIQQHHWSVLNKLDKYKICACCNEKAMIIMNAYRAWKKHKIEKIIAELSDLSGEEDDLYNDSHISNNRIPPQFVINSLYKLPQEEVLPPSPKVAKLTSAQR